MAILSDRLTALFQHTVSSQENLLAALKKRHPELRCTWETLFDLLNGRQDNPSILLLEALAEVFAVDPAHFLASRYADEALHPPSREQILAPLDLDDDERATLVASPPSLASKLSLVMAVARDAVSRKPFTMTALAKRLQALGIQSTPGYLITLMAGGKKNPSKTIIEGLATILHVDAAYFIDSIYAWPIYIELGWLRQLQQADLQFVAARALNNGATGAGRLRQLLRLLKEET